MMGRIWAIFPGHNLESCLNMTKRQLRGVFLESLRQEARQRLTYIGTDRMARAEKSNSLEQSLIQLELQAFPPDPDDDGDMGTLNIREAKKAFFSLGVTKNARGRSRK